jgi:F0F1-type ATP synthase delta subunit
MDREPMHSTAPLGKERADWQVDLDQLLHPADAFDHPADVVNDPDLTLNEKRAILASWASDASAVEAAPMLRSLPKGKRAVSFDEVIEALRALDEEAQRRLGEHRRPRRRRLFRRSSGSGFDASLS